MQIANPQALRLVAEPPPTTDNNPGAATDNHSRAATDNHSGAATNNHSGADAATAHYDSLRPICLNRVQIGCCYG
jgi:hypothetical protein